MPNALKNLFGRGRSVPVSIQRDYYTMAIVDGESAEITMYGIIVQERPRDWWTDEPVDGDYIVLDEFLEDLSQIANVRYLTIRLNSVGGDAYAAIPIHNRLRELKAEVIVIVDGVAMSGGSLIMCAADIVRVNPSSLIMIHRCWITLWGGYNADELRKLAASNDAVDKAQAAIYKRKCGMNDDDILALMSEETYMTGSEAVNKGFADELIDGEKLDIAASADMRTLFVNGRALRLDSPMFGLPSSIPTVNPEAHASVQTDKHTADKTKNEGGNTYMASTIEELRKEYPELTAQLENAAKASAAPAIDAVSAAVANERKRMQEIEEIAPSISDQELVREAMFGENPCTAQELAFQSMKQQLEKGASHLAGMRSDYATSGASGVRPASAPQQEHTADSKERIEAQAKADAAAYKKMKEGSR